VLCEPVVEITSRYSMFAAGQKVGVAVSGGADSVALLHVLFELAPRWNLSLEVLHLNHRLRGEASEEDARFVAGLARELGLPVHQESLDVAAEAEARSENLEQAARQARRSFFARVKRAEGLDRIAVGHTRDDQAETVLFRLLRGTGPGGLAAILPVTAEGIVRPLLGVRREQVLQYLEGRALLWREDATNADRRFSRNRIRHELLPQLAREWNPRIANRLADLAELAYEEEAYWGDAVGKALEAVQESPDPGRSMTTVLNLPQLAALPAALRRRVIREAVARVKGDLAGIGFHHISRLLELAQAAEGHDRVEMPGLEVMRSFEWARFAPTGEYRRGERNYEYPVDPPQQIRIPGSRCTLMICVNSAENDVSSQEDPYNSKGEGAIDFERITGPLLLRNWRPGDQYHPVGVSRKEKIKTLFQQSRIPLWHRRHWPVLVCGEQILWSRRFGVDQAFAANTESQSTLRVWEVEKFPES
jgi:tRNA(Ile)-lysidine synthase